MPWRAAAYHAPLLAFQAQTTSGFSSLSVAALDGASKLILIGSMLIGGDIGSTAGGVKVFRVLVVIKLLRLLVVRASMPRHAVYRMRVGERQPDDAEILAAVTVVLAYLILAACSWLPFLLLGYDPLNALFEVVSALATCGLSAGIAGPDLHPLLKGVLCVDMLAGRLEVIALLVVLYPRTWVRS